MLEAALYHSVYLVIVVFLTIVCMNKYAARGNPLIGSHTVDRSPILLMLIGFMIVYLGFRPISGVFVDMRNYENLYNFYWTHPVNLTWNVDNKIFDNMFMWMAVNRVDIRIFFLLMAIIYIGCMGLAMRKIFKENAFYAMVVFLGAFSTFSYGTNGIKAGAAASIFLLALAMYPKKKIVSILLLVIAYGFHHSMQLPIAAFLLCMFYRNTNAYIAFWFLCLICSMAHITYFQTLFGSMTDDQGSVYLMNSAEGIMRKSGFRFDFVIYSAIPIAIGWWSTNKMAMKSQIYTFYFNIYLFVNAIWLLCMYAPFTNRIAYLSWQILPLVSIYPFLNKRLNLAKQYVILNQIVLVYLLFTVIYNIAWF